MRTIAGLDISTDPFQEDSPLISTEEFPVNRQTAYADCKKLVERDVKLLANDSFSHTFMQNATAFGTSPRMRFDIVLNNLAGLSAWTTKEIKMTSNGTPWRPLVSDIQDWKITCVDTGLNSNIGQRFKAVEKYLESEESFLANYSDGLIYLILPEMIYDFEKQDKVAGFLCVKSSQSFHLVSMKEDGLVKEIQDVKQAGIRINDGYFIFKNDIFKYIKEGEDLVCEPFQRLIDKSQLLAYKYDGFWACMDTFKEQQQLDDLYSQGKAPWEVWRFSDIVPSLEVYPTVYPTYDDSIPFNFDS